MVRGRTVLQITEEYAATAKDRGQLAALWGARALCRLRPEKTKEALALATSTEYKDLSIQVRSSFWQTGGVDGKGKLERSNTCESLWVV